MRLLALSATTAACFAVLMGCSGSGSDSELAQFAGNYRATSDGTSFLVMVNATGDADIVMSDDNGIQARGTAVLTGSGGFAGTLTGETTGTIEFDGTIEGDTFMANVNGDTINGSVSGSQFSDFDDHPFAATLQGNLDGGLAGAVLTVTVDNSGNVSGTLIGDEIETLTVDGSVDRTGLNFTATASLEGLDLATMSGELFFDGSGTRTGRGTYDAGLSGSGQFTITHPVD